MSPITPKYSDERATLYQGDALAVLAALDTGSADAAVLVSSSGPNGAWLTAQQARHLAGQLPQAADAAEAQP